MPQYSVQPPITGTGPQALVQAYHDFIKTGPCSAVEIHVPDAYAQELQKRAQAVPNPVSGTVLIDTGASISGIDDAHAKTLQLQQVNTIQISSPTGTKVLPLYAVKLEFPGTSLPPVPTLFVAGIDIVSQGVDVLIGRDWLNDKVFIYNGPMRLYTVCY